MKTLLSAFRSLLILAALPAAAATYHVDPASGNMSNPGSAESPWSTLQAVFAADKTFAPGDLILLRSGDHGFPEVKGHHTSAVTIMPEPGAIPKMWKMVVKSGSHWVISGLDISAENISPPAYGGSLVEIQNTAHHITVRDCRIRFAADASSWSLKNWQDRGGYAITARGTHSLIEDNRIENVGFAVSVTKPAIHSVVRGNQVTNFSMDGIRALADFCTYENNSIINCLTADDNHDDFFQSWSTDDSGSVGRGTVRDVVVRGNIFISGTVPGQPLVKGGQGIGCFDGMFENWIVENNVISSRTYHGITLSGAVNCRIVNNTVAENPVTPDEEVRPWVRIYEHKDYATKAEWARQSTGNLVRNNICCWGALVPSTAGTTDHNLATRNHGLYYQNFEALDFYPRAGSPAIGAGTAEGAPATDHTGRLRTLPMDAGAYDFSDNPRPEGITDLKVSRAPDGRMIVTVEAAGLPGVEYGLMATDDFLRWENAAPDGTSPVSRLRHEVAEPAGVDRRFYRLVRTGP